MVSFQLFDSIQLGSEKINESRNGRKPPQELVDCFSKSSNWLEEGGRGRGEVLVLPNSFGELIEKMIEFADGKDICGVQ